MEAYKKIEEQTRQRLDKNLRASLSIEVTGPNPFARSPLVYFMRIPSNISKYHFYLYCCYPKGWSYNLRTSTSDEMKLYCSLHVLYDTLS